MSLIGGRSPPEPLETTNHSSFGAIEPLMMRWMPPTNCRLSSHRRVRQGSSCSVAVSMMPMP